MDRARRLQWALAVGALAAACSSSRTDSTPARSTTRTPPASTLDLEVADADVWAWEVNVAGKVVGPSVIRRCAIELKGSLWPAVSNAQRFYARVPLGPGDNSVSAWCETDDGELRSQSVHFAARLSDRPATPAASTPSRAAGETSFLDDAVIYGVVPAMFEGATPLRGTTDALDRIAALGATAIWLSPIFATDPDDFGYAITDYERVRSDYGTAEDLRALVAKAHRLQLRVLLDFVPSRVSTSHLYYRQAERLRNRSHYFDFFEREAQDRDGRDATWKRLAGLRHANPEVARWMTEMGALWIRSFGIDGYRVDSAWSVRRRSPGHWPQWIGDLRRIDPDLLLVAEGSARDPYYLQSGFDLAYDWTHETGEWAWKDVFAPPQGVARRFADAVIRSADDAGRPDRILRYLNNNDTGARFVTRYGENMLRTATVALMTLPGVPCLYAFDEIGAEFEPYGALRPLHPPDRADLRELHAKLIRLRRSTPALHGRGFTPLPVTQGEVFAYVRQGARAEELALVALNLGPQAARVELTLPPALSHLKYLPCKDLLTGRSFFVQGGRLVATLAAWETLVLAPAKGATPVPSNRRVAASLRR
jgi:glycosidase